MEGKAGRSIKGRGRYREEGEGGKTIVERGLNWGGGRWQRTGEEGRGKNMEEEGRRRNCRKESGRGGNREEKAEGKKVEKKY